MRVFDAIVAKNLQLLLSTGKDVDLVEGVYGKTGIPDIEDEQDGIR